MSFCTFQDAYALFDCTPLENLFIQEYMLRAPGDFVKVYIYGLMQCYHPAERMSLATMAKDLGVDEDTVFRAFQYWERQGAVRRVGDNPVCYAYKNLKQAQLTSADPSQDVYRYREFNEELRSLFDKKRRLYEQDYQRVYDWIETLQLPQEVVLMLIRHCIDVLGVRFSFEKADAIAQEWARSGVTTIEDVEEMTRSSKEMRQGLLRVLRRLGQRRNPTQDEEKLYEKWVKQWGFSAQDVQDACAETTKSASPSMAYLDAILARQRSAGGARVAERLAQERTRTADARRVLAARRRVNTAPTEEDERTVAGWLARGFELEAIETAAKAARRKGDSTLADLERRLEACARKGLFTREAMDAQLRAAQQDDGLLARVYEAAGMDARPSAADRALLRRWQGELAMPMDVVLLAASYAAGKSAPMTFADRILQSWHAAGIGDVQAARAEHDRHAGQGQARTARPVREVAKHRYGQRSYTDEEMDALFFDIMKDGETDGEGGKA